VVVFFCFLPLSPEFRFAPNESELMSDKMNTSAKRLLELIKRLDNAHTQGELIYQHYFQAFHTKDYDTVSELVRRSKQLVSQYADDIKGLDDEDLFTVPVTALLNLFSTHQIHSSYSGLRNHISGEFIITLRFADRALSRKGMEKELPPDVISEITESVNELERLILNSDLPPELKRVLNEYVGLFRKALTDYQIIGIQAFKDASEDGFGKYAVNREILNKPEAQAADKIVRKSLCSFGMVSGVGFKPWDTLKEVDQGLLNATEWSD
jgi:hypothetical protein